MLLWFDDIYVRQGEEYWLAYACGEMMTVFDLSLLFREPFWGFGAPSARKMRRLYVGVRELVFVFCVCYIQTITYSRRMVRAGVCPCLPQVFAGKDTADQNACSRHLAPPGFEVDCPAERGVWESFLKVLRPS